MYYSIIGGLDFIDADENIENGKKVYVVNAEKIFKKLREKGSRTGHTTLGWFYYLTWI